MWRAFFLAVGIFLASLGAQCLAVEQFVMAAEQNPQPVQYGTFQPASAAPKQLVPTEWVPWTLLSTGSVVVLYSLTINKG